MNLESSVDDLTLQTTNLLNVCVLLRDNTSALIANAVVTSVNAAQIPLVTMATNLIDTQSLLVTYIARG
jgi:ABC-type uncharacterized transport system substrate-binding protein